MLQLKLLFESRKRNEKEFNEVERTRVGLGSRGERE
jgi:hypothetical protein